MVCLKKIQFLIHKFKIATKVELLSFYPEQNQKSEIPLSEIQFNKIGFFKLDSNERSDFQTCELKSIDVSNKPLYAALLKIVLHAPY